MADPGYPVGGVDLVRGGVDSRGSYVSKILYVKTKESGPIGGRAPGTPLNPPMNYTLFKFPTASEPCITYEAFNESDFLFDNNTATCKTLEVGEEMTEHVLYVEPNCTITSNVSALFNAMCRHISLENCA